MENNDSFNKIKQKLGIRINDMRRYLFKPKSQDAKSFEFVTDDLESAVEGFMEGEFEDLGEV